MKTVRIALGVLLAASLALPALAQQKQPSTRMYKCVDEAGKVYYSDSPRADCNKGTEMNRQGVVLKKPGEKGAIKPVKVEQGKSELASSERRDRALMATYMTEQDIDAARDRSLVMPMQAIKAAEAKLDKSNTDLLELKKQADGLAAKQKPLPPDLLEEVHVKQGQVGVMEADLAQKKAGADAIRARYEADKVRFRELKGGTTTAAATTAKAN